MRLLVSGWRNASFTQHYQQVEAALSALGPSVIIQGECPVGGVDALAKYFAKHRGLPCIGVPMNTKHFGKSAGPIRNQWMLDHCKPIDHILVVMHKTSVGTWDMFNRACLADIPFTRIDIR